ncbi:hypothetical protein ID866_5453 [Astraeus odoratus]|nr:hypothetical protein ID866_5453 [Astraeus odoratus]
MATRRRIGVRVATTEAARRQLMQPVACWEKVWVAPDHAPNSTMRVYKWVKTEKKQQFSDDEGGADDPLAPLPDEPEGVEGDEDMDQDEPAASMPPETEPPTLDATETNSINQELPSEPQTKPPSPGPPALSLMQAGPPLMSDEGANILDASLEALNRSMDVEGTNPDDVGELHMGVLGPEGTAFEDVNDLSRMTSDDTLLGTSLMDNAGDPFAQTLEPSSHPE